MSFRRVALLRCMLAFQRPGPQFLTSRKGSVVKRSVGVKNQAQSARVYAINSFASWSVREDGDTADPLTSTHSRFWQSQKLVHYLTAIGNGAQTFSSKDVPGVRNTGIKCTQHIVRNDFPYWPPCYATNVASDMGTRTTCKIVVAISPYMFPLRWRGKRCDPVVG